MIRVNYKQVVFFDLVQRHHLFIALSILRREECNILENLSQEDYKEFLELMTWNILGNFVLACVIITRVSHCPM